MRIAILSDIHANSIALERVLNDVRRFSVEYLMILGDIIGYYYWPDKVLDLLCSFTSVDLIAGNHEHMLKSIIDGQDKINQIISKYGSGINMAIEKLTVNQQNYLINQPSERQLNIDGCKIFVCHGSPFDNNQYVYPDAPHSLLQRCALSDFDFVFMGHTHYPFCFQDNSTMLINPGSVGQPRDIGKLASYVIIDTQNKSTIFRRVAFDIKPIIKECEKHDPNLQYLKKVLTRNSTF